MKNIKNFFITIFSVLIIELSCCKGVNALFGNSHFYIGQQMLEQMNTLPEQEKTAFLSGLVYADIGRFKFDRELGIESDSDKFVNEMEKHIENDEEKWFVNGFKVHNFQDEKTGEFFKSIFTPEQLNYYLNCSFLEYYFMSKNSSFIFDNFLDKFNLEQVNKEISIKKLSQIAKIPQDKMPEYIKLIPLIFKNHYNEISKNQLKLYDNILIKTYDALGLKVTKEDIQEQASNILGIFIISSNLCKEQKISEHLITKIDTQTEKLTSLCLENFKNL